MKCCEREQLFAYRHRLLAAREEEQVRAHVAECAACRAVVEEYGKLDELLDDWRPAEPSPWFEARLRAAIASESAKPYGSRWPFIPGWARWLAPALGVALVLVASLAVWRSRRVPERPVTLPVASVPAPRAPQNSVTPAPATAPSPTPQVARLKPTPPLRPAQPAVKAEEDDLSLYENLTVLEDYDLLANFDVLSELPRGVKKVGD
jgi:anti-sigma factor RsiW